jgi:hypothetical protein
MYLDLPTLFAVLIALVTQMIMIFVLFRSTYKWEQHYWNVVRMLKIERNARR